MTIKRMKVKNQQTNRKSEIVPITIAQAIQEKVDNIAYAFNAARNELSNPSFAFREVEAISTFDYRGTNYSDLAASRFRLGGSALLTALAVRTCERESRPLSEGEKMRVYTTIKTGLREEYIQNISQALSFGRSH